MITNICLNSKNNKDAFPPLDLLALAEKYKEEILDSCTNKEYNGKDRLIVSTEPFRSYFCPVQDTNDILTWLKEKNIKTITGIHSKLFPEKFKKYNTTTIDWNVPFDYTKLDMKKYKRKLKLQTKKNFSVMLTSVGCPHICQFCILTNMFDQKVTFRNIEYVKNEIDLLCDTYDIKFIHFLDPNFTIHKKRCENIIDILKKKDIEWSCQTRFQYLDNRLTKKMENAGCVSIQIGADDLTKPEKDIKNKIINVDFIIYNNEEKVKSSIKHYSNIGNFPRSLRAVIPYPTTPIGKQLQIKTIKDAWNYSKKIKVPMYYLRYYQIKSILKSSL